MKELERWPNNWGLVTALGVPYNFSDCTGTKVWERNNLWSANAYNTQLAIFTQSSDFNFGLGFSTVPTNKAGGGSGICDGNTNLAYRFGPRVTHGIAGFAPFPNTTELGMTMAIAYPINSLASGIWGTTAVSAAWKHNEWATANAPNCGFPACGDITPPVAPVNLRIT